MNVSSVYPICGLAGADPATHVFDGKGRDTLQPVLAFAATPFFRGEGYVVFFPAFILGASISSVPPRLWHRPWILAGGISILVFANVVLGHGGITRCFEMAGATVLVGAVANGRLRFLSARLPLFPGAISYPFYLTHVVGLLATEPFLATMAPTSPLVMIAARAVTSIALTILLAWLRMSWWRIRFCAPVRVSGGGGRSGLRERVRPNASSDCSADENPPPSDSAVRKRFLENRLCCR
jgi:peptidoglycan/LPS O-acetylase OafA/YrhL